MKKGLLIILLVLGCLMAVSCTNNFEIKNDTDETKNDTDETKNDTDETKNHTDGKFIVNEAIETLLNTENYLSEWVQIAKFHADENLEGIEKVINSKIFHSPYKSKSEFIKFTPRKKEITALDLYQFQRNSKIVDKYLYTFEDGSVELDESEIEGLSCEWFVKQVKNSLISEEYVGEETVGETKVKKYEITVDPYPFIIFFGVPFDKRDELTKIYLEEYKECTGFAYIDTETNCIRKLEFDLTEQTQLNQAINQRIQNETDEGWWFEMYNYQKLYTSFSFSDINDESAKCAEIEKEIVDIIFLSPIDKLMH